MYCASVSSWFVPSHIPLIKCFTSINDNQTDGGGGGGSEGGLGGGGGLAGWYCSSFSSFVRSFSDTFG